MKNDKKAMIPIPKNEALLETGAGPMAGGFPTQPPVALSTVYPPEQSPHLVPSSLRQVRQLAALHGVFPASQVSPAEFLTNPTLHMLHIVSAVEQTAQFVTLQVAKAAVQAPSFM